MVEYDVYLGLGSNLGDRRHNLDAALSLLARLSCVRIVRVSSLFETLPVGQQDQPLFLNAVVHIRTTIKPENLLRQCLDIEAVLGRVRTLRWGPRTIDIDIVFVTGVNINTGSLTIPHPRALERAFVLVPLAQISPDYILPDGRRAQEAANLLGDGGIELFYDEMWECRWRCSDMKQ